MLGDAPTRSSTEHESSVTAPETALSETVRQVADDALARRIPPVRPDELRNPMGPAEEASARAANNARWWSGLTDEQRSAVIETYPQHIGNAEGISAGDRDRANRNVLQQMREQADAVQSKADRGERLSGAEKKFLRRMDKLDLALRKAAVDATQAGVDGPLLLAFDASEFGGDGRAVLSYGADPYTADSVSWHVPGVGSTVDSMLGFNTTSALHHLQAVQQENPGLSAASIAWVGYDAPSGWSTLRAAGHGMARTGGDILYSDITAFNAARDTLAGDGRHFTGNHVFGYSYGSTTTGYAGQNGRLARQVRTVSLVGSPGAGPVRTAGEFGIGADNVFVASSSRDVVTALGGRASGSNGRILGIGLGTDPAMDSFGAVRVTGEPPASMNRLLTGGTHHAYFLNTESTTNLGRVAAGRTDAVTTEQHRTEMGRSRRQPLLRTVEPAGDRVGGRRFWNALWRRPPNCAVTVADELSTLFGRTFGLDATPSRRGVPARALFQAVGSDATFATYDEVEARLLGDPSLRVAVLTSQWAGGRQGGHAYLAVKVDGQVQLYDPHTRKYSPWPPHWGQHAVTQTAVGYLQPNGDPVGPMTTDVPLQLDAADAVGNVQGPQTDPDFTRRQAEYRAQDPATRLVDSRYAEPLGDVVDNASDHARVQQLARDLSGVYGPYRIQFSAVNLPGEVMLTGDIYDGDNKIGKIQRSFDRDSAGNLVAYHSGFVINEKLADGTPLRGRGFSKAVTSELERFYVHSGIDRIELTTHDKGAYAWARRGYAWDPGARQLQESLDRVKMSAGQLRETVSDEAKAILDQVVRQLDPSNPRLPEPIDLANLATTAEPDLGRRLLDGTGAVPGRNGVHYVKYLDSAPAAPARTGLKSWLQNLFGRDGATRADADDNCAYGVAGELSTLYGRRFDLSVAPTSTGVPAWALFQAAQSRSQFATYTDIETELLGRPAGSSAIVVSRWSADGGRQGGHAYLAVTDGEQVQLYDPRTRQYSPWPPHWGEGAVDRTAVGYLDENGAPVHPIGDEPVQVSLRAADSVGDVKGLPDADGFLARQQEYRTQDPTTRRVDSRYLEPLGHIVDNLDTERVQQLAADLSGRYGPYRVEMFRAIANERSGEVIVGGAILNGDEEIGFMQVTFVRDGDGNLVAHQNVIEIPDTDFRGKGFSKALRAQLEGYYAISGVDRVELRTEQDGGYAWARQGFTWNPDPAKLQASLDSVRNAALQLRDQVSPDARVVLDDLVQRLDPSRPDFPEPFDVAALATAEEPHLGRDLLTGTHWSGVRYLDAADAIGDVQGHSGDSDYPARQQEYRGQDPAARQVDSRYAEPVGDVVDNAADQQRVHQMAQDLSGVYGPFRVELQRVPDEATGIAGYILSDGKRIGTIYWSYHRDAGGNLVAFHGMIEITSASHRGKGFSKALAKQLEPYYVHSGVDRIEMEAAWDGAYAWASWGFGWAPDTAKLQDSLVSIKSSAQKLRAQVGPEAQAVLDEVVHRLEPDHPRLPEPIDLARLTAPGHPDLGQRLLTNTNWHAVRYVDSDAGYGIGDVQGLLATAEAQNPVQNCALDVADRLSERYGRDYRVDVEPTRTGVPARALYEAVGSSSRFATYAEVEQTLRQLGDGSSAVVTSRWRGGRSGGHAYLAVNDGDEIYLIDRETGQRSGWPPHWGQGAVDRTAVGYLDANGDAVNPLHDVPLRLGAADSVGDVKGAPREPDSLGDVVDNLDPQRVRQLAEDLSGTYGPYRVEFRGEASPDTGQALLSGTILNGDNEIGSVDRAFYRDEDGNLVVENTLMSIVREQDRGEGFSKALSAELERYYVRSGVHRIELTSEGQGSNAWARRGFTWGPDLENLQGALDQIKMRAEDMYDGLSAEGRALLDDMLPKLEVDNPRLPEPIDLAILETEAEPDLGRRLLENTSIDLVKYLSAPVIDPVGQLGLPDLAPGSLSEGQAIGVFSDGESKLRQLNEELTRNGVSAEERARQLSELRNSLRTWTYQLMSNRDAAEFLSRNTTNPTFEDLVARNTERGLTGDAIYEAIVDTSTHSRMAPGSLTDIETGAVYSQFELGLRALNEQMIRDGVSAEDRARTLAGLRSSLRAWTRELMENRPAADWLSANESNPSFEDLVARYERKGLSGDAVYEAIIDGATHSHYSAGTLSDEETRTVYTTYELRMRELRDQLLRDGVGAEERARTMYGMRATIRSWTRSLMSDRQLAEWLNENEPNPTFDELVERNRAKGRVGDEIYEAIVASSTRSRGSVNAGLGIDPDNPPDLPPMRGPDDDRPQDQEEDTT
ncbi:toxin glutamine deamidase domain-containing protein [Mycolicibacterium septicum]|nr:toxin glutamine deamidase domain-containing protein [Mycolicibacterium septicum]